MSKLKIFICFISFIAFFSSCTESPHISSFCEKDKKRNYIVKWEIFPEGENEKVDIFSSIIDSIFPKNPVRIAAVNDYIAILPSRDNTFREFFQLRVGKSYSGIISNRFFDTDNIQNLRDIGGYFTKDHKQVKWGKLYRSGDLSKITEHDKRMLDSLQIKTVIDFRTPSQVKEFSDMYETANYISIPIDITCFNEEIKQKILEESFFKGDAIIYTQDCYRTIIEKYASQYAQMLDILTNEDNYPVLFHCGLGKDRTGLAAYFILQALDVQSHYIDKDYLYSNKGINKKQIMKEGKDLPESMQEAITTIFTSDLSQLKYAISCMKKKSGSVENYLEKELDMDNTKKEKLRKILLY